MVDENKTRRIKNCVPASDRKARRLQFFAACVNGQTG